jgi:hypothetical protein
MAVFDPSQHKPEPRDPNRKRDDGEYLTRAGIYLLAFTWMKKRDETPNGNGYAQLVCKAIARCSKDEGLDMSCAGDFFLQDVFLNANAYKRLGALLAAMGVDEAFDLDDDKEIRRVMLRKPFKAKVQVQTRGGRK